MSKNILEGFKILIQEQIKAAQKYEMVQKATKDTPAKWAYKGKYDPWLLEPRHIAIKLELTISQLERLILDSEDAEIQDIWKDYNRFHKEVLLYDNDFGQIRPQLAEFALGLFDRSETTTTDAILKLPTIDVNETQLKISKLEKEVAYYKKKVENAGIK